MESSQLSLTAIYHAINNPYSSAAATCQANLAMAPIKILDHTFNKWYSYAKGNNRKWSTTKLIRCLDYILTHSISPSELQETILKLHSFRSCLVWILRLLDSPNDEAQLQMIVKFICNLLESVTSSTILGLIQHKHGVQRIAQLLACPNTAAAVRFYCIRGLLAQSEYYKQEMLDLNMPQVITNTVLKDFDKQIFDDSSVQKRELYEAAMACRLLDHLVQKESNQSAVLAYAQENGQLLSLWVSASRRYMTYTGPLSKNLALIMYYLTNVVYKCSVLSIEMRKRMTNSTTEQHCFGLLMFLSQKWCHQHIFTEPISSTLSEEERTLLRLLNLSLTTADVLPQVPSYDTVVYKMVHYLTCFFVAFLCQGVVAEQVFPDWLNPHFCIEVEERGYMVDKATWDRHQHFFAFLLDIYIHYIQLYPQDRRMPKVYFIAWSLKSFLLLVHNFGQLDQSSLVPRLMKLVVFFLHDPKAIEVFSNSPTVLSEYIWSPTIQLAKQGLEFAAGLSDEEAQSIEVKETATLYKADRAFVSLELVAKHNAKACERLVECNVLELIDLLPMGDRLQAAPSLLTLYAKFVRLIATLTGRAAFIRVRLRDTSDLFAKIKSLLSTSIDYKKQFMDGYHKIIKGCLLVILSFRYDESSMRQWLSSEDSITSLTLPILFPWARQARIAEVHDIHMHLHSDKDLMALASILLEQASIYPLCVRQVIEYDMALPNLCKLIVTLGSFAESTATVDNDHWENTLLDQVEEKQDRLKEETSAPSENNTAIMRQYVLSLRSAAIRILESGSNIQAPILSNAYTLFFQAIVQRPRLHNDNHKLICASLYQHKMNDFQKLYRFAQTEDDSALKLYEMTAVAIGYATLGAPSSAEWNASLGLESEDNSKSVFGSICQMLVYNLEYEQDVTNTNRLDTVITPLRRNAAAQVVEILAMEFASAWYDQVSSVATRNEQGFQQHGFQPIDNIQDQVAFVTDDQQQVVGCRPLLRAVSPIFRALLSSEYVESGMSLIPLHDVTYHSLKDLVQIIHQVNEDSKTTLLSPDRGWRDIIRYLAFLNHTQRKLKDDHSVSNRGLSNFRIYENEMKSRILYMLYRPQTIGSIRTFTLALVSLTSSIYGHPLSSYSASEADEPEIDYGSPAFYEKMAIIMFLVLLGGVFAGLTLGLMGMDETNLHVLIQSGTETEKVNAKKVLSLLDRGKHWVLVTLLLSNVIVNETLPIILDGVLGGGWKAVVISTALIVIFGEVIPQSVCVRYGLAIGAKTAGMVLALMYLMYPIAYPTALLLDYFLGESHGTIYKKAGLKTLVSLHQSVNPADVDALTEDEVTIIGAVLDLRQKPVSQIMTPIADVFTLSTDDILNEETVEKILTAGYSRIPVHAPGDNANFVGMLLTKRLITYDPEDARPVKDFQISTLPETGPDTSCLDILNFFQEGKSHMALISNDPGGQTGALGVITLEDVIEELIGEEIIDETDVYVDGKK
ncbi:DUF21-domain-containing protein [Rhizopus microsporus var. microsporus]|uniref:DUF21-domain-containing protein n=1 Tax=Rhizopus microsporus var. microsporus TaxID=86635 RepID=A0A1X0R184_RHIZD|nr:DUF21-domain-containing protein [Rhizopus microsporus var. microsporus]